MTTEIQTKKTLTCLFKKLTGKDPVKIVKLPPSGSERKYYRIFYSEGTVIGVSNPSISENEAFLEFTKHFTIYGLPVPSLLAVDNPPKHYLIQDLGDQTLFSLLPHQAEQVEFPGHVINIYKKALDILPQFQIKAGKDINYEVCYPRKIFDSRSMYWDLNYFKYYFLKLGGIVFNEQHLEDDFSKLIKWLSQAAADYFMYRDFQSRNIMVVDDKPWFIDYQGGRKGPLQYDIASFLFDAKANVPFDLRTKLLYYYLEQIKKYINVDTGNFIEYYYGFVLIRIMQAMGTYGFRGFFEKKPLFLQSIPYAQNNLKWLIEQELFPDKLPHLKEVIKRIIDAPHLKKYSKQVNNENDKRLTIVIRSFAYKNGIPQDDSGNGGGFVFDCRALPNPGRSEEYKNLSGKDKPVIQYLEKDPEVIEFINKTSELVISSAKKYIERGFTNLMVCYGCTGGQHRSVYCAEKVAKILLKKLYIIIDIKHNEENEWVL